MKVCLYLIVERKHIFYKNVPSFPSLMIKKIPNKIQRFWDKIMLRILLNNNS